MGRRIQALSVVLSLCFLLVLLQLVNIQVVKAKSLNADPLNPRVTAKIQNEDRGDILAANGSVLAQSVVVKGTYQRIYPYGSLFAHIVGFNSPVYSNYGLEEQYNTYLATHTLAPQSIAELLTPRTGIDTITTTVVPPLQQLAAAELAGRDGAVVVLQPQTGAVLAMFDNPTFNPNLIVSPSRAVYTAAFRAATCGTCNPHGFAPLTAMAYQDTFAPGSTSKVVTSSAAYDFNPALATKYYPVTSTISLPQSNKTLSNFGFGSCGGDIATMLPPSCDTGFAELGLDLGGHDLAAQANAFGYNLVPPLDLPGVVASTFPSAASFLTNQPGLAYSAIGQENVAASALQNALIAAGIANGGVIMQPRLVTEIRDQDGALVFQAKPTAWRRALSKTAAAQLVPLMQDVATYGTAAGIFPPALQVAAKTGTAQAGYPVITNTHDWMIAFAPASKPTVAIAVVLPWQPISQTGAEEAGPVMKCMIEGTLAYEAGQPVDNTSSTCPA